MQNSTFPNLREKEKVALRLLLNGYDAKSAAREIGVTPNVINEHLRSGRQKFGVTSSKEAARLLAELEGISPNFLGSKDIGIVPPPQSNAIHPLLESQAATSDQNRVREIQTPYLSFSEPLPSVPFRRQGETGNDLSKAARLRAIADLTVKLAATFAFICFAAILVSTLISRI